MAAEFDTALRVNGRPKSNFDLGRRRRRDQGGGVMLSVGYRIVRVGSPNIWVVRVFGKFGTLSINSARNVFVPYIGVVAVNYRMGAIAAVTATRVRHFAQFGRFRHFRCFEIYTNWFVFVDGVIFIAGSRSLSSTFVGATHSILAGGFPYVEDTGMQVDDVTVVGLMGVGDNATDM